MAVATHGIVLHLATARLALSIGARAALLLVTLVKHVDLAGGIHRAARAGVRRDSRPRTAALTPERVRAAGLRFGQRVRPVRPAGQHRARRGEQRDPAGERERDGHAHGPAEEADRGIRA